MTAHLSEEQLLAWAESAPLAAEAAAHLSACPQCEQRGEALRRGVEAARRIAAQGVLSGAERVAMRADILRRFETGRSTDIGGRATSGWGWRWSWGAAALAGLALAGIAVVWSRAGGGRLQLDWDRNAWSGFERIAAESHRQTSIAPGVAFASSDVAAVREWVYEHAQVRPQLAVDRPAHDGGAFELLGASTIERGGRKVGLIAYRVDGKPVTLLVARSADEPDAAPAWRPWRKALRGRRLAGNGRLVTWNSSGTVYSLAIDGALPLERACFVCHTTPARRQLIRDAQIE